MKNPTAINLNKLQKFIDKEKDPEVKDALQAIKEGEEEYRAGKTKALSPDMHELLKD